MTYTCNIYWLSIGHKLTILLVRLHLILGHVPTYGYCSGPGKRHLQRHNTARAHMVA